MSTQAKVTVPSLQRLKGKRKIVMVTAYDTPSARAAQEAEMDVVLVGDSLGMVILGYENTLPVTMDEMFHHVRAVRRGLTHPLLVADMPYLSFHISPEETIRNAGRLIKEAGAEAVKIEGGSKRIPHVTALIDAGIPVMGHLGLTPQSLHTFGGYRVQGKEAAAARMLSEEAAILEETGIFALVLEGIPDSLAKTITRRLTIPTIGIGAGPHCDGQVLVFHDLLGWNYEPLPKFVHPYADLKGVIHDALENFKESVQSGSFPADGESYGG